MPVGVFPQVCMSMCSVLHTLTHSQSLGVRECVSSSLPGRAITVMDGPCVEAIIICYVSGCVWLGRAGHTPAAHPESPSELREQLYALI